MSKLTEKQIKDELWRRGELSFKLDSAQKDLHNLYHNTNHKVQTWLLARRSGKSHTLCVIALEQCIKQKNSIVKIVSPTRIQVTNNIRPVINKILEDCPDDIKPEFKKQESIYYFSNGSEIHLAGSDNNHAEKMRGSDSHIAMIDEAGSCKDLDNIVKNILLPTTLITQGKIILASTPPKESDHEFLKYIEDAEFKGALVKRTFKENPRLTPDMIRELTEELGGESSDSYRREMLCEIVKESSTSVLPEATDELLKSITKEWPTPPFLDSYVSMDIGFNDLTVVLFGYFDFRADKIIIQDEICKHGKDLNLDKFAQEIMAKEQSLWTNPISGEYKKPFVRVSDINYIVTQEIARHSDYEVTFKATDKDDKNAQINNLRVLLANNKIIINPKCKTLIKHLLNVKWRSSTNKKEFARSPDDGHYDAVDAMIYFCRAISSKRNPYPAHYDLNIKDLHVQNPEKFKDKYSQTEIFKRIFNRPRTR